MHPNPSRLSKILPYAHAVDPKTQQWESENYAATPPALWVVTGDGTVWTLGLNRRLGPAGEFEFDVLRAVPGAQPQWTGDWASRIERRGNRVRIFTTEGYKYWNGKSFF